MAALRPTLLLALIALAVAPAAAVAKPHAQPLVDAAPFGTKFKDRVTSSDARVAHAAATAAWRAYSAGGTQIAIAISPRYGNSVSSGVAQSYADFLQSLDHGSELAQLKIYIAPPTEVETDCGGLAGTLACYDSGTQIMTVPGQPVDTGSGVTTSYVVAHEYGHHIAAFRSNAPFQAFTFGPKYWASDELVCDRTQRGLLAPGNESDHYFENPGESWAETYAQLKYPGVAWQYTGLLKPDAAAFAAARQDVLQPWSGPTVRTFKSSFARRGASTRTFSFQQRLDGSVNLKLAGPRRANYGIYVSSGGFTGQMTKAAGANDRLSYQVACREQPVETVRVTVKRLKGSGPFTLRASYPG